MKRLEALGAFTTLIDAGRVKVSCLRVLGDGTTIDEGPEYLTALVSLSGRLPGCHTIDDLRRAMSLAVQQCNAGQITATDMRNEIDSIIAEVQQFGDAASNAAESN